MSQGGMGYGGMHGACCHPPVAPVAAYGVGGGVGAGVGAGVGVAIIAVAILILIALGVIF